MAVEVAVMAAALEEGMAVGEAGQVEERAAVGEEEPETVTVVVVEVEVAERMAVEVAEMAAALEEGMAVGKAGIVNEMEEGTVTVTVVVV